MGKSQSPRRSSTETRLGPGAVRLTETGSDELAGRPRLPPLEVAVGA